eukprot:jgi/Tetstr1/444368/TSEL_032259.t1
MAVDTHNITLYVNRENKGGHRKCRDGFKPLIQIPATAVPTWTALLRRFIAYRDAAFRAAPSAKQPDRFWALPGDMTTTPPLTWNASTLGDWLTRAVARINPASFAFLKT